MAFKMADNVGVVTTNLLQSQGVENLIDNGTFSKRDMYNYPVGFYYQSFTFSNDTDGALICIGNTGTWAQLSYRMGSDYTRFKGKSVVFCAEVKVASTSTSNFMLSINDGVSENDTYLTKDDQYHDVYVVRQVDQNATRLYFSIITTTGNATTTSDKVYVRNVRAYQGTMPAAFTNSISDGATKLIAQQGFINLVKNGNFNLLDSSNKPLGFYTQALNFSVDTDGALICTGIASATWQQIKQTLSTNIAEYLGKYITLCAEVKIASTSVPNYCLSLADNVSQSNYNLVKDDQYHDVYITKKIDSTATSITFNIVTTDATAGTVNDKIYVRNIRAYYGTNPLPFQKNPTDIAPNIIATLPTASAAHRGKNLFVQGTTGVSEIASLAVTAGCTTAGNATVALDGVSYAVALTTADSTATLVATKIRAATYPGWTAGGTGTTVTFTCNTIGAKTDPTYSAGSTGATGTMTITTQGITGTADAVYVCKKLANDTYDWVQIG